MFHSPTVYSGIKGRECDTRVVCYKTVGDHLKRKFSICIIHTAATTI